MGPVRQELKWAVVADALTAASEGNDGALTVLDLGGGTGPDAVRAARCGHRLTVLDTSPDALALLGRRAAEATVEIDQVCGDAVDLPSLLRASSFDVVLCHGLLEFVDDPSAVLAGVRAVLKDSGVLSLVLPGRADAVRSRAVAGDLDLALRLAEASIDTWDVSALGPRSYWVADVHALLNSAGFAVEAMTAVRSFADDVPSALVDGVPGAREKLFELERATRRSEDFCAAAVGLQALARLD